MKAKKYVILSILIVSLLAGALLIHPVKANIPVNSQQHAVNSKVISIMDDDHDNETNPENGDNGDDHNGIPENETEHYDNETNDMEEEHELRYNMDQDHVEIESPDNKVKFEFDKPKVEFQYQNQTTEVSFQFKIIKIVEFYDENGDLRFDDNEILFEIDLDHYTPTVTFENTTDPLTNNTLYHIIYNYTTNDGVSIILEFLVSQKTIGMLDGGADSVKYTLTVYNWPWQSNSSYLATITSLEYEIESESEGKLYNATMDNETYLGYVYVNDTLIKIDWNRDIIKDGVNSSLVDLYIQKFEYELSNEEDESEKELELRIVSVYPHFNESLVHDPIIGVEDDPQQVASIKTQFDLTQSLSSSKIPQLNLTTVQVLAIGLFATLVIAVATIVRKKAIQE